MAWCGFFQSQAATWFCCRQYQVTTWFCILRNQATAWSNGEKARLLPGRNHGYSNHMKDNDLLRLEQLERKLGRYRDLAELARPKVGWIRTLREALGMSSPQLAKRLGIKAAQSVEDMQKDEVSGTIKLQTLKRLAEALNCEFVYAFVPGKPLQEILRDRATEVARRQISPVSHSMKLEEQGVSSESERNALNRRISRLLSGNLKKLWD
jgi:predicted DNA-binding mobile mystery protein A